LCHGLASPGGVGHQTSIALKALSVGRRRLVRGISKTSERGSLRGEPVPVMRGAPLADAVVIGT
jgi:hypothetical protein